MSTPTPGSGSKAKRRVSAGGGGGGGGAGKGDLTPLHPRQLLSSRDVDAQRAAAPLVFRVVEVDSQAGDFGATLWIPQASMLSASLSASQLVSVSVCLQNSSDALDTSQVENLEERCSGDFGVAIENSLKKEPGSYRVIASAWPCRKLKEGVRVSKQLAYALGCSQSLPQVYLSPITYSGLDHSSTLKLHRSEVVQMDVQECQELVLRLCPHKAEDNLVDAFDSLLSVKGTPERQPLVSKAIEASPCSPANQQPKMEMDISRRQVERSGFSISRQAASPKAFEKKDVPQKSSQSKEQFALPSLLGDENSKAFKLLETLAGRLLHGRYLLKGNLIGMSVCGQGYIFQVVDAKSCSTGAGLPISEGGRSNESEHKISNLESTRVPTLFLIGSKVQVKLVLSVSAVKSTLMDADAAGEKTDGVSAEDSGLPLKRLEYSALGGLSEQISTLKEIIKFSLLQPERLLSLGLQPPHGVLLYGPPGTGKTSLALASANEAGVKILIINGPEIVSEYYGESEAALIAVFATAQATAPAVVFIDELDAIAPQRTEGTEDLGRRLVATLLTIMDGGDQSLQGVLVIAATNRVEVIDPALRRPGRFDREIEIGVPSPSGRREILLSLLARMSHALTKSDIETLSVATHGFVGADLASLCNEAALVALRHFVHNRNLETECCTRLEEPGDEPTYESENKGSLCSNLSSCMVQFGHLNLTARNSASELLEESLKITMNDFEEAKTRVRPSAMREVMLEVPKVRWSDVGGQEEIKQQLQEAVEWPQKHMDAFYRIGTQPPRGILLYGPPGCSKTLMARAVATEAGLNFIAVKGPELFSKWVGESEKAVRSLFQRARVAAPSVVFFDELDGLAVSRDSSNDGVSVGDRVMSQLLVEMDGLSPRKAVTVIAATNRPDKIDAALLRPGRFDRLLYVGPPDECARLQILEIHTKNIPCAADVDKRGLARCTNGYTGADIASICREAAMAALEDDLNAEEVSMKHFSTALSTVKRSVSEVSESFYAPFSRGMQSIKYLS